MKLSHVCLLIDGNRSYAIMNSPKDKKMGLDYIAYNKSARTLRRVIGMTFDKLKIPYLTVNLISRDNCILRKNSARMITKLTPYFFGKIWMDYFIKNEVRVKFVGDLELFCDSSEYPEKLRKTINDIEARTARFTKNHLILLAGYDLSYESMVVFGRRSSKNKKYRNIKDYEKEKRVLVENYYGFQVPRVNMIIRTWRPKLSALVPFLIGDQADIYLFPAPFPMFNFIAYKKIVNDYNKRISSLDAEEIWNKDLRRPLRRHKGQFRHLNPVVLGSKTNNMWLPS